MPIRHTYVTGRSTPSLVHLRDFEVGVAVRLHQQRSLQRNSIGIQVYEH
jgi:hypothetical protein